jgi:hypothetical protein
VNVFEHGAKKVLSQIFGYVRLLIFPVADENADDSDERLQGKPFRAGRQSVGCSLACGTRENSTTVFPACQKFRDRTDAIQQHARQKNFLPQRLTQACVHYFSSALSAK